MELNPIGTFRCAAREPYDAPRQGVDAGNVGTVVLDGGRGFEQALRDLDGFSRIWVLFHFDRNDAWKPMVQPPRGARKVGVFASRAPYRPNPIGLSCVRLIAIRGLEIDIADHDLLDGTPILDIKPYIPYADSFPDAHAGWLEEVEGNRYTVRFSEEARERLTWLAAHRVASLETFLREQLAFEPTNGDKKRVRPLKDGAWGIAYRTWRARFAIEADGHTALVQSIYSGYTSVERDSDADPYGDKGIHREYVQQFGSDGEEL